MATNKAGTEIYQLHHSQDINSLVHELNGVLSRISSRINALQGVTGDSKFGSSINMSGNRITNIGDPSSGDDAQKKKLSLSPLANEEQIL